MKSEWEDHPLINELAGLLSKFSSLVPDEPETGVRLMSDMVHECLLDLYRKRWAARKK